MSEMRTADLIAEVLQSLGIKRAHIAARQPEDWHDFIASHRQYIASLTLIGPGLVLSDALKNLGPRLMVVSGDQSPNDELVLKAMKDLPTATFVPLDNLATMLWTDIVADRLDVVSPAMSSHLSRSGPADEVVQLTSTQGEIAGITYNMQGSGPPLVLLPLGLSPSQWDPILPNLQETYCTIVLTGPKLGIIPLLEERGTSAGYIRLMRRMIDEMAPKAGESILDIGCGSGVVDRWLAKYTQGANPIVSLDVNAYLLQEAEKLTAAQGYSDSIDFRQGNAEALPFSDNAFDLVFSTTVMEEVDADVMLNEMIRVAKPGGRIGVNVRALDLPRVVNVPVKPELKSTLEAPQGTMEDKGCADASLYRRFHAAGLNNVQMMPDLTVFSDPKGTVAGLLDRILVSEMDGAGVAAWQTSKAEAIADGSFFLTWPHHCAVGTKL